MNGLLLRISLSSLVPLVMVIGATAADQTTGRVALRSVADRKPAPDFVLKDSSGRTVTLKDYQGKVVLLDFWATWCHGCKEEIPWFSKFERKYRNRGFVVIGVSMDEGGWKVVSPFLAGTKVRYTMLLGDDSITKQYGIGSLPDAFLVDRDGKIAASYLAELVDRADVEAHIKALLSNHPGHDNLSSKYDSIGLK